MVFKKKNRNLVGTISYGVGLLVVFGSHVSILASTSVSEMVQAGIGGHAVINIVAGVLLVAGWLLKE